MDEHFKQNRAKSLLEEKGHFIFTKEEEEDDEDQKPEEKALDVCKALDYDCNVCQERFEQFWSDDHDSWMSKDVYIPQDGSDPTCHMSCYDALQSRNSKAEMSNE